MTDEAIRRVDALPESFCLFLLQNDPETAQRNPCVRQVMSDMQWLSAPRKSAGLTGSGNNSDGLSDTPQKRSTSRAKER